MTEFQRKRLEYFIKAADKSEYIQLGPGDAEWLEELQKSYYQGYEEGFVEGQSYVESGEKNWDEQKADALKEVYK